MDNHSRHGGASAGGRLRSPLPTSGPSDLMRYFFVIRYDFFSADDDTGEDLPSNDAARREAVKTATSVASDLFITNGSEVRVIVRSEQGPLLEVTVKLTIK